MLELISILLLAIAVGVICAKCIIFRKKQKYSKSIQDAKHPEVSGGFQIITGNKGSHKGIAFGEDIKFQTVLNGKSCKKMIVFTDLKKRKNYCFSGEIPIIVGRDPKGKGQKLYLTQDRRISREHCMVYEEDHQMYIRNISKNNVVFLNGKIMKCQEKLPRKSVLQLGRTKLKVEYDIQGAKN